MKTKLLIASIVALSAIGTYSYADDDDAKATGLAGGAVAGAIVGGPVGAVVGGAIGLTTGAAIDDTKTRSIRKQPDVIIQQEQPDVVIQQEQPDVIIDER